MKFVSIIPAGSFEPVLINVERITFIQKVKPNSFEIAFGDFNGGIFTVDSLEIAKILAAI
jgi:predicted phage gp36 major capsid-like protein